MPTNNKQLTAEIEQMSEAAGYLWEKGWAERNGGNISVNLTECLTREEIETPALKTDIGLSEPVSALGNSVFYLTGTGKRMRDVARKPFSNGTLVRISADGERYDILGPELIRPTSEITAHLLMHDYLCREKRSVRAILHTHPTELVGLTHCRPLLDSERLTRLLWSMIPECRIIVPKGLGIVPYEIPGTVELARATIGQLKHHDVVVWEKHGVLAAGDNVLECFDAIDTLVKAAQIYFCARSAGFEAEGMTVEQLDELAKAFDLPPNTAKF